MCTKMQFVWFWLPQKKKKKITGPTGHPGCECAVEAASDAREHTEGLCWIGSRE